MADGSTRVVTFKTEGDRLTMYVDGAAYARWVRREPVRDADDQAGLR